MTFASYCSVRRVHSGRSCSCVCRSIVHIHIDLGMRGVRRKHAPARETSPIPEAPPTPVPDPDQPPHIRGKEAALGAHQSGSRLTAASRSRVRARSRPDVVARATHQNSPAQRLEEVRGWTGRRRAEPRPARPSLFALAATPPRRRSPRQRPHHASTGCLVARSRVEAIVWLAWPAAPRYAHFLHKAKRTGSRGGGLIRASTHEYEYEYG